RIARTFVFGEDLYFPGTEEARRLRAFWLDLSPARGNNDRKEKHRMKFRILTAVALILSAASIASAATDAFNIDSRHSEATFRVRHLMTKVSGKFADVGGVVNIDKANPSASTVNFTTKTATIDTGVADRDKHLRSADFFDVDKFPEITFKSTKIAPVAGKKDVYSVTG